jgi:hypothetical protein
MVERVLKMGLAVVILLATFIGCQRANLLSRVKTYVDAANRHDLDAIDDMFTEDIVFEINGKSLGVGKEQVRVDLILATYTPKPFAYLAKDSESKATRAKS